MNAQWIIPAAAAAGLLLLIGLPVFWVWRRRRRRDLERRLREACRAVLANFVIPDGNAGEIEVQYALLTGRGILVVDIKDVDGHVFGSEGMQDWTVIARNRRFTFPNPQPGLWDRVAAVRRLMPDTPVTGYIAFTDRAKFNKGWPRGVVALDGLLRELEHEAAGNSGDGYLGAWQSLREAAVAARIDHLINAPR